MEIHLHSYNNIHHKFNIRHLTDWGTPTYNLQVKIGSGTCIHTPPCDLQYRTIPPSQGGLRSCHMFSGSGSCFLDKKGSVAATCTMALDPLGGLWCTTCPAALNPASLIRRASAQPCVPWLRTRWEGSGAPRVQRLWIPPPDKNGSSAATCITAPDLLGELRCTACPVALNPASR
jgi:hypothetical protein